MVCIECNESHLGCGCVLPNLSLRLQLWGAWDGRGLWWEDSRHWAEHSVGSRKLISAPGSVPREPAGPRAQPCQGRSVNARCKVCHSKCRHGIKHSCLPNWDQGSPSSCLFGLSPKSPGVWPCSVQFAHLGASVTHKGCQCSLVCPPWWLSCAPLLCAACGCMCP